MEITVREQRFLSVLKNPDNFTTSIQAQKRKKKERNRKAYIIRLKRKGEMEKKEKIELRREALLSMQKKGYSVKEICQKLNISKATYYRDMAILDTDMSDHTNAEKKQKKRQDVVQVSRKSVQRVLRKVIVRIRKAVKKLHIEEVSFFKPLYYKRTPLGVLRGPICHGYVFNSS